MEMISAPAAVTRLLICLAVSDVVVEQSTKSLPATEPLESIVSKTLMTAPSLSRHDQMMSELATAAARSVTGFAMPLPSGSTVLPRASATEWVRFQYSIGPVWGARTAICVAIACMALSLNTASGIQVDSPCPSYPDLRRPSWAERQHGRWCRSRKPFG